MRKILTFLSASALALGMGTALGASSDKANTTKTAQAETKKGPSFMFVLSAKQGKIKKDKDGGYILEMDKADINHVIAFSDRPYHIVKYLTGNNLAKGWTTSEDSFAADSPNGVLSGSNFKPHILILKSMKVSNDTVTYKFMGKNYGLKASSTILASPVLVIDSSYPWLNSFVNIVDMW